MRTLEEASRHRRLLLLRKEAADAVSSWENYFKDAKGVASDLITGSATELSKAVYLLKHRQVPDERLHEMLKHRADLKTRIESFGRLEKREAPVKLPPILTDVSQVSARVYQSRSVTKLSVQSARAWAKKRGVALPTDPADFYVARPPVQDCVLRVLSGGQEFILRGGEFDWAVCVGCAVHPMLTLRVIRRPAPDVFERSNLLKRRPREIASRKGTTLFAIDPLADADDRW